MGKIFIRFVRIYLIDMPFCQLFFIYLYLDYFVLNFYRIKSHDIQKST